MHALGDPFDAEECGMAFVHVGNGNLIAEGVEGAHTAHTEENFLAEAIQLVATIELTGHIAELGAILGDIGIEQNQRNPSDIQAPSREMEFFVIGERDLKEKGLSVRVEATGDGEGVDVVFGISFHLPTGGIDDLFEIAFAIEETDTDQRDVEIGRGFEMVAGQDAEAAGVDMDGFVQTEFHGEVGNAPVVGIAELLPVARSQDGFLVFVLDLVHVFQKRSIFAQFFEALLADGREQADGVVFAIAEKRGADAMEERGCSDIPTPPSVIGEGLKKCQILRNFRRNGKCAETSHKV